VGSRQALIEGPSVRSAPLAAGARARGGHARASHGGVPPAKTPA